MASLASRASDLIVQPHVDISTLEMSRTRVILEMRPPVLIYGPVHIMLPSFPLALQGVSSRIDESDGLQRELLAYFR